MSKGDGWVFDRPSAVGTREDPDHIGNAQLVGGRLFLDTHSIELKQHPSSNWPLRLDVALERRECGLRLRYTLRGGTAAIILPPAAPPIRTDELWRSTCFELFLRGAGEGYREYNFSPSGQWAAYAFDDYRSGMRAAEQDDPVIRLDRRDDAVSIDVGVPGAVTNGTRLALTAVIERNDGVKSYWSLAHPAGGPPDFHHQACFAATVPPIAAA